MFLRWKCSLLADVALELGRSIQGTCLSIDSHSFEIRQENDSGLADWAQPEPSSKGRLARSAAHCRTAAAIVLGDHSAAITQSRCTKHRRIEHRLERHGHQTRRATAKLFRASAAMSAAPEAKLVAKLHRAFAIDEFKLDGLNGFEIAIEARGDARECGA